MTRRDYYKPAPEPDQDVDEDPLPEWVVEGRCEWCLAYLPADGLCRCPASLEDLRAERAWLRYEEDKD